MGFSKEIEIQTNYLLLVEPFEKFHDLILFFIFFDNVTYF